MSLYQPVTDSDRELIRRYAGVPSWIAGPAMAMEAVRQIQNSPLAHSGDKSIGPLTRRNPSHESEVQA